MENLDEAYLEQFPVRPSVGRRSFQAHLTWCSKAVVFSHDSTRLASWSLDRTIKIWDVNTGICLQTFENLGNWGCSLAFSHTLKYLVSAFDDRTIKTLAVESGECQREYEGCGDWIKSVAYSHDYELLASSSLDMNIIKIWSANSGVCLQTLKGHTGRVKSLAFSNNSAQLTSASNDGTIKIWNENKNCLRTLQITQEFYDASFEFVAPNLYNEFGIVTINRSFVFVMKSNITEAQGHADQEWSLNLDGSWIQYRSRNVLWLPFDYRPICSAVSGSTIGIGFGIGKVLVLKLTSAELPVFSDVEKKTNEASDQ